MKPFKFVVLVSIFLFTLSLSAILNFIFISPIHELFHYLVGLSLGVEPEYITWGQIAYNDLVGIQGPLIGVAGGLAGFVLIPVYFIFKRLGDQIKTGTPFTNYVKEMVLFLGQAIIITIMLTQFSSSILEGTNLQFYRYMQNPLSISMLLFVFTFSSFYALFRLYPKRFKYLFG